MASRRKFKKQIKEKTDLLIEDAYMESINGDSKEAEKMDSMIDDIIDDRIAMLNKVCAYPNRENRANVKAHFNDISKSLETKATDYNKKIGRVG